MFMIKPIAKFILPMDKTRELGGQVKGLQMYGGYYSNLRNIVDLNDATFNNMESHDCHVFMKTLLPIAFGALPNDMLKTLIKISQFLKTCVQQHCE